jgi:Carbohydrate-selective porin, OprB family
MKNLLSKNLLSPILIAIAVQTAGMYSTEASTPGKNPVSVASSEPSAEQIEQATQATEIRPGDWAYKTLQALSTKYSCGNVPTGNKVLSREEFATSLNGCVQSIEQLVARKPRRALKKRRVAPAPTIEAPPSVAPEVVAPPPEPAPTPVAPPEPEPVDAPEAAVTQQDLDRLKGLIQSFSAELQGVDTRLQAAEDKVTKLQAQSFSTTTKLVGEVIFSINGYGGRGTAVGGNERNGNIFGDRVRLNLDTSFTGKDRLRTRLQARNLTSFNSGVTGTNMTRLGYDGGDVAAPGAVTTNQNIVSISKLQYTYPLSSQTTIIAEAVGSEFNDNFYTFNPILESSGTGALSRFGRFNPVYRLSNDGASLSLDHKFSNQLGLSLAYAVPGINNAGNPATPAFTAGTAVPPATTGTAFNGGGGLFNGSNAIFSQLTFRPTEDLNLGVVYARSYHADGSNLSGGTGSSAANSPFGGVGTSANSYSFLTSYKLSPNFIVSGWAGFTEATRETAAGGNASSSNYAISLAFPDLGQKGNALAFVFGIPPKLNSRNGTGLGAANAVVGGNPDTSYHLEALYKVKLSDNLTITPGIILITNPEHNRNNPTEYVGSLRTTFKF